MTDRELIDKLKSLKNSPELGGDVDVQRAWSKFAEANNFPVTMTPAHYTFRDYVEFYVWQLTHVAVKPLVASAAMVVLLFAGWIGATNASFGSLPGDRLYPVKLSLEQLQLAVALDAQQRSQLEFEITARRLDEMVELTAERNLANPIRVRIAVDQFKDSVTSISNELTSERSTELAKTIGRKTETYRSVVRSTATDVPKEVADQVAEVKEIIDNTEDQAVEVIITTHENQDDPETAAELKATFEKQFVLLNVEDDEELQAKLDLAQALAEEGSYRRAFQLLKEVELLLKQVTEAPQP